MAARNPVHQGLARTVPFVGALKDWAIAIRCRGQPLADGIETRNDRYDRGRLLSTLHADPAVWSKHVTEPFAWIDRAWPNDDRGQIAFEHEDAVDQRRWFEAVYPIFQLFIATDSGTLWSDLLWHTADGWKSFGYLLWR
jgi:hypothetical protein